MDLLRYSCQVALPGFGDKAQLLLQQASVLVVGAGGLGCPAAQYLASSGIGTLGIADGDTVSVGNLHRQILFTPADEGKLKATVATERLEAQNPQIQIVPHVLKVDENNIVPLFEKYDLVIDCTDNFETRYLINDAAVMLGKPVVFGAVYQFEGQVAVWNVLNADGSRTPNYRDIYPSVDATQIPNCAEGGVLPMLTGIIGCMQANEAVKYITKTGELLTGKMFILDTQSMQSRVINIGKITKTNITSLPNTIVAETISVKELKSALETSSNIELVDIRSSEEHEDFNLGGRHVQAYKLERELSGMDNSKTFILYCTIGKRSAEAVRKLRSTHPELNILSLEGGIREWLQQAELTDNYQKA